MAYGPLCQCAFMSYGPRIQLKAPAVNKNKSLYDKLPPFSAPMGCEAPPPGAFTLMALDVSEAKADASSASRSLGLEERCVVFGSSQEHDGQVFDGSKGVAPQHCAVFYKKSKWWVKAINGVTHLESMTLHPYLRSEDGRAPKRYTSANPKKIDSIQPMDGKRMLSREMCVLRFADSDRRFWIQGSLPSKEGEYEEGEKGRDKKDRDRGRDRDRDRDDRGKEKKRRDRDRSPSRSRSRSHRKRR
eukprot:TRINITY_DN92176_c0_g1_i1.p1 TRINITY_DN92176_c0_g1~~TRINITY_DN92176_c0_g1_i1.p1  ORF type:complete len:244 (-),score=53.78 TRINITY_DN92176_c0_g1_i1:163-894(-)